MIKILLQQTIGTKIFLYGAAIILLIAWFPYFRVINYQYWLQSELNIFFSVSILFIGEATVFFLYELCRKRKKEMIPQKTTRNFPMYDNDEKKKPTIVDHMKEEMKKEEEITLQEDIEKSEEESWRII